MESQTPELPPPYEAREFLPTAKVYPAYEVRAAIAAAVLKERAECEALALAADDMGSVNQALIKKRIANAIRARADAKDTQ